MQKNTIRLISFFLLFIMLFSAPIPASAESSELTNEPITESQSNEGSYEEKDQEPLNIPEGQTIILPLAENPEGEIKDFTKENVENNGLMRLSSVDTNTVYAPTGVNSYQVNGRIYLETTDKPIPGAMLQVLAADGETILAYSSGIDQYYKDYETGYYYINYPYITLLQEITAGTYSMQLVAGKEKIPTLTNIVFTDQPLLEYVNFNNFYSGSDTCEINVNVYNSSDTQLEQLTFSLLDSNGDIVGQTSGLYRKLNIYDGRQIRGYTLMNINGSISKNEYYRLAITYTGEGTFCDATGGIADYSFSPSSDLYPEITNLEVTDPMTGEVKVYVENLDELSSYILTIRDGYYGKILHQSTVSGANSPFTVNLTLNGLIVPISGFNTRDFSIQIQQVGGYMSDSKDVINPYFNNQAPAYYNFDPFYINPHTTELPFKLRINNAGSAYRGETDFTISVKTDDGTEIAFIAGDETTVVHILDGYEISGTLNFSTIPNDTYLYIFFNTEMINAVYVTDALQPYYSFPMCEWAAKTFWLMMDQLYLQTDVINSSGNAKLVLKDKSGTVVSESNVVSGTASEYYNHLNYEFILTPQLENGQKYSLVLVDGEEEFEIFGDFTYDGEILLNQGNFHLRTYDLATGDTRICGEITAYDCKNITSTYLSNFLKNIVLKDDVGIINNITGYTNGRFENYIYYFDIILSSPLSAGDYTITYPDGDESGFYVYEYYFRDKTPMIYVYDVGDSCIIGEYLPPDAVYKAKIYQGYNCLTNEPFILTHSGEYMDYSIQYLYIPNDVISNLDAGSYEMRVYMDDKFLGTVPMTILDMPQQTVVAAYDPMNERNILLSTSGYVSFRVSDVNKYKLLRFSEDISELSSLAYEEFLYTWYDLSPGDGEKTLYVQLKDNDGNESGIFRLRIYRLVDTLPALYVHENQEGVYSGDTVTLLLGADTQYLDAFVDFINPEGIWLATAQLNYKGLGEVTAFGNSGGSSEIKHIYSSSISTTNWSNDLEWNYNYFDRQRIEPNLKDTMFVRYYLGTGNVYNQTVLSEVVERFLVFGSPDSIIMPQFSASNQYYTNDRNVTLKGFATPDSTVTLNATDDKGQGFTAEVQANQYGYFKYTAENIDEGEYVVTATDDQGLSLENTSKLIIDRTPPEISWLRLISVDHQNVAVQWACLDTDVSEFRLYVNGVNAASIPYPIRTEYSRNILARYGDSFRLIAADRLGNITVITREIGDKDDDSISAALSCPYSVEPGDSFEVGIGLCNLDKSVYAQDITLTYDADIFEYVSVSSVNDDIKILKEDTAVDGKVRLIAANIGGVSGNYNRIFNLIFKVKGGINNAEGNIAITSAKLGLAPEGTVIEAAVDSKTITVYEPSPVVDKTALIAAINNAQRLYDAAVVGTEPGQYPQEAKDALLAAINAAKAVKNDANATQTKVDNAVIALIDAVEIFKASVNKSPDLNDDGTIDVGDLAIVAYFYGINSESPAWNEAKTADMNNDNIIDIADLAYIAMTIPY